MNKKLFVLLLIVGLITPSLALKQQGNPPPPPPPQGPPPPNDQQPPPQGPPPPHTARQIIQDAFDQRLQVSKNERDDFYEALRDQCAPPNNDDFDIQRVQNSIQDYKSCIENIQGADQNVQNQAVDILRGVLENGPKPNSPPPAFVSQSLKKGI